MKPTVNVLASGLKFLLFQGVTTFQGSIIVATLDSDLLQVAPDGTLTPWANVGLFGIPTGIAGLKEGLIAVVSGQESGHFLVRVTQQGKAFLLTDLSELSGEFGAPFAVAAHEGHYPYYMVAVSTDVIGSSGLIARVTRSGKTTVLTTLANTPFGIGIGEDYVIVTQEKGQVLKIAFTGKTQPLVNLAEAQFGSPLDIKPFQEDWMITTTNGWLVALKPDGTLFPVINISEQGYGSPTTLTALYQQVIVATQTGNLLQVVL